MATHLTPQEFDKQYEYISDIGSGTFGQVFKYKNKETQKLFAIKKIICYDFIQLSQSIQELILLSTSRHNNIINVQYYCMVQEENKLPGGKIDIKYSLYLFMDIGDYSLDYEMIQRLQTDHCYSEKNLTSALVFLQRKVKISHRDIKPQNILKLDGVYKLTDFGVSKMKQNESISNTLTGSPPYLSPQLFQNYQKNEKSGINNSYKSDAFSLGLVILGCALLKDISGINQNQEIKSQILGELKGKKRYGQWLFIILENLLQYEEENRWDFVKLYNFLGQVNKDPQQYDIQMNFSNSSSKKQSLQNSPAVQEKILNLTPTLQFRDLTMDSIKTRVDTLYDNSSISTQESNVSTRKQIQQQQQQNQDQQSEIKEEQKQNNPNTKKSLVNQAKFVILGDDDDNIDLNILGLSSAETFNWKKNKFNENKQKQIIYPEGKYMGQLDKDKQRHGKGEFMTTDGTVYYNGDWVKDYMEGTGQATWEDGKKYIGEWIHSQRSGKGKQFYQNGDIYDGEFLNDVKHGKGTYISHLCEKYEGEYKYGEKEGYGIFQYSDGTIYEGQWKSNKKQGLGKMQSSKGVILYEGEFKNNQYNGKGKLYYSGGKKIYEGEFKNNLQHGKGKITQKHKSQEDQLEEVEFQNGIQI